MPEEHLIGRARQAQQGGKPPSTQAGEFVRKEIDHGHEGKHEARSVKQAIAIGLSKARRAGVKLPSNPNNPGASDSDIGRPSGNRTKKSRSASSKAVSGQVKPAAKRKSSAMHRA